MFAFEKKLLMRPNVSELLEKINRLARQPQFPHLPKIESDLLKGYLRDMYEMLEDAALQQTDQASVIPITAEKTETIQPEMLVAPNTFSQQSTPEKVTAEKTSESKTEELQAVRKTPIADDMVSSVKVSINDRIKPAQTLNEKVKSKPVEVHHRFVSKLLKNMIDLNKRFVFVNELFKGDADGFAEAIKYIDSLETYDAAQQYLTETLLRKYAWNETSQAARLFNKMIKQKFGEE